MKRRETNPSFLASLPLVLLALAVLVPVGTGWALDTVKTANMSYSGTIEEIGKYEVKIRRTGDKLDTIPTNEIESIRFDSEPPQLNLVRSALEGGRYEDALRDLEKVSLDGVDKLEIKQDVQFIRAVATSRLALGGAGDVKEAGTLMSAFVRDNPGSFHFLEATEVLGDLYMAVGVNAKAMEAYGALESAPWPDVKMRGGIARGRAQQADSKFDDALTTFEGVLQLAGGATNNPLVEIQRQAATVGKAVCLAETGKAAEGIKLLEEVVAKADPEAATVHSAAYNGLGACYRKAGKPKDALLAYLHVDLLYNGQPNAHAEALAALTDLWKEVGNADRSLAAEQLLMDRYKNSKWAKR